MKAHVFVSFHAGRDNYRRVGDIMEAIKCMDGLHGEESILCGYYSHTFEIHDTRLPKLRRFLKSEGIAWSEREEHTYTDAELRAFPLLSLGVDRKPLDAGGPEYGTTYDLSGACPQCGTGAVQTSPLLLPLVGLPKTGMICSAAEDEALVTEPLKEALEAADVSGLELRQVHLHGNNEPLPWWQMISDYVLPKFGPKTRGVGTNEEDYISEDGRVIRAMPPCPACRRDGRYGKGDNPEYLSYARDELDLSVIPDVVHSWESLGRSGIDEENPQFSRYGSHILLVKPKVFDVFRRLKVRHATFGPVHIDE